MAFWTFTPPTVKDIGWYSVEAHPLANRLMGRYDRGTRGATVWIWSDDTVSEGYTQPPGWELNPSAPDAPYVRRVFYGASTYTDVTDAEKALLQAAGYTVT